MIHMAGAVLIIVVLAVVIPVLVLVSGAVLAAILGYLLMEDRDEAYEPSELVELNY
ncbi:MAG: hypothetical protein JJLCMIEE_01471 [Acidimicrobiales bacterium]|nr:hypothetical protein [Acidimicrobiales bacterium]